MAETSLETMQEHLRQAADLLPQPPELTFKPMFGGVCGYADGRIFASLSNVGLALKLSPEGQAELLMIEAAKRLRYEPDAPESKQYIVVPEALCGTDRELAVWVKSSLDYVLSLPAPKPKRRKDGSVL